MPNLIHCVVLICFFENSLVFSVRVRLPGAPGRIPCSCAAKSCSMRMRMVTCVMYTHIGFPCLIATNLWHSRQEPSLRSRQVRVNRGTICLNHRESSHPMCMCLSSNRFVASRGLKKVVWLTAARDSGGGAGLAFSRVDPVG